MCSGSSPLEWHRLLTSQTRGQDLRLLGSSRLTAGGAAGELGLMQVRGRAGRMFATIRTFVTLLEEGGGDGPKASGGNADGKPPAQP